MIYNIHRSNNLEKITMPYGQKRITTDQAREIRANYASGLYTQSQLALMCGVSQSLVSKIINDVVHKRNDKLGGEAIVKVGFRYGN
jgi:hypothetical protein